MIVTLAQLKVSKDINKNKEKIVDLIKASKENTWLVFPEGLLSGYYPENQNFIAKISKDKLHAAIEEISLLVKQKNIVCLLGTVTFDKDTPLNSTIIFKQHQMDTYNKCNLATLDRKHFKQGNILKTYKVNEITFGIQMCRENAFPEQWAYLKKEGAQIIFHTNNAVSSFDGKKIYLLNARAQENQFFVVSVNAVTDSSPLASYVIDPLGQILYEAPLHKEAIHTIEIDLNEIKNDYLNQKREDLVKIVTPN
jgi:predicted amidohydrolase